MASRGRVLCIFVLTALLTAGSLLVAAPAQAKTLTVCPSGCQYTDISEAVAAARNKDEISIGEGTYEDFFSVNKDLTLRGAGRDKTTIKGLASGSVISVTKSANVALVDLTITGGGGALGGGISNEGQLVVTRVAVRGNASTFVGGGGGGIWSNSTKPLRIFDSDISENTAAGGGGGIFIQEGSVFISATTISANRTGKSGGGILNEGRERLEIRDSEIRNNEAATNGGGILVAKELLLVGSTVSGNRAKAGGGLAGGEKALTITRGEISGNIATGGRGGGILAGRGGVRLDDSDVVGNTSRDGAGVYSESGDVDIRQTTVGRNTAAESGGGIFAASAEITLNAGEVIDNQAGGNGGGIYLGRGAELRVLRESAISGNLPDQCFGADC